MQRVINTEELTEKRIRAWQYLTRDRYRGPAPALAALLVPVGRLRPSRGGACAPCSGDGTARLFVQPCRNGTLLSFRAPQALL